MANDFQYIFEWDPKKAFNNRRKHGVGFEQAALVFRDPQALSIYDQEHSETEDRWITLGKSEENMLVVVHTCREISDNKAIIRIISARRATKRERRQYEATR